MASISPQLRETEESTRFDLFDGPISVRSLTLSGIFVLLAFYTLYFARFVCIPITLALILDLLLGPAVTHLHRWHVPRGLSAVLIIGLVAGVIGGGAYFLSGPAEYWIDRAPQAFSSFNQKTNDLQQQIQDMNESTKKIKKAATQLIGEASKQTVTINQKGLRQRIVDNVQWAGGILFMTLVMLYFMLASRGLVFRKLLQLTPAGDRRSNAVRIVRRLKSDIGCYLLTVTLINTLLGLTVTAVLWLIGLSDPILWGVLVGVLNFAPYVGAACSLVAITLASFATFDTLGHVALAPLAVFALTTIEGNFVTPSIHGRRFEINALVVFVALFFWGWLWGVAGMLMAVPLLVIFKVTCEHITQLRPIGRALGR